MGRFSHSKGMLGLMAGVASLGAAAPAWSQGETPDGSVVEELVVTARRRAENLTEVPISLTVQTGEQLEQRGSPDITSLQRVTPNLTLQVSRGANSTLTAFIRGVGQQDPLWGFEPGVGLYVDDVYIARPQGAVLDIYDVERIEVLRGPQGTLYGRNTIGGAIKYVTKRLDMTQPHLRARASLGSYQQRDVILSGSIPLGERAAVGAAFAKYDRDGYGENIFTGADTNNKDVISGRLSFEARPTDSLFIRLAGDYLEDDSNANHGHRERPIPAALAALVNPPACRLVLESRYDTCAGLGDANEVITKGASLLAEWSPEGPFTFKSITAYRKGVTHSKGIDFDNTPARIVDAAVADTIYRDDQFSQELQLLYEGKRVQGVAGVYYLDGMASGQFDTILQAANLTQGTSGRVDTKSFAVFADVSYDITDRLSASVGGRWTRDKKKGLVFKANYLGLGSPITGRAVAPFVTLTNYTASKTFEEFTPRVSLTYKLTEDVNAYAAYGRGFKSGGFDMRGDATATPATRNGYEPEIVDSYEAGLKGALFDRRLRFTTAAFYTKYKGQQITTQAVNPAGTGVVSFVDNVGASTIYGAEFEAQAQITDRLSASLALGYTKPKFDRFISYVVNPAPPPVFVLADVADQRQFQNTPKWTGNLSLAYEHPLDGGARIQILGSMSFRSKSSVFETPYPLADQKAYELFDLSLVYLSADDHWRVGVYGRNLADKRFRTGAYTFAYDPAAPATLIFGDSMIGFYGPPRTVTVTLDYRF
jgi:iron complex outermembrane receptor protein